MAISLESNAATASHDEKAQLAQLISDVEIIKDQMSKVAVVLKHLSEGLAEQRSRQEPQNSEMGPILQAMKVHVDSFPHALREARRSDVATQKALERLAARVSEIESKLGTICTPADLSKVKG
jgi:hypothetical protein